MERLTIDIPEEYLGAVTQLMLAACKGSWRPWQTTVRAGSACQVRTRLRPHQLPQAVLTETRGTGIASSISEGHAPGRAPSSSASLAPSVADRAAGHPNHNASDDEPAERAPSSSEPSSEVYEGQVVGENHFAAEDMDVNIC